MLRVVCLLFGLLPLLAAAGDPCDVKLQPHGITYNLKDIVGSCRYYNWLTDDTVQANEERFNSSVVYSRGPWNITLVSCHEKVSYRNMCNGITRSCLTSCPVTPGEDASEDGTTQAHSSVNLHALIGSTIAILAIVVALALVLYNKDKVFRYFQVNRGTICRCSYSRPDSNV